MSPDSIISRRYYINLTRREDRRLRMEDVLAGLGWEAERVRAADARYARNLRGYPSQGRYACALSHRMALRRARLSGAEAVLILEDDVVFHPALLARLNQVKLPVDWGMFYLGCQHLERPEPVAANLLRVRYAYDAHAYVVKREWLREVLRVLDARRAGAQEAGESAEYANDVLVARLHRRIPTYAAWPNLAWQLENPSDLANGVYSNYDVDGRQKPMSHLVESLDVEWAVKSSGQQHAIDNAGRIGSTAGGSGLRLHLGCGPNRLDGWANLDLPALDIRKVLPFADSSVGAIFLEHVIEHVAPADGWRFFEEAFRVLRGGGVLRLAFPDVEQAWAQMNNAYTQFIRDRGWGDGSPKAAMRAIVCGHEHRAAWSAGSMKAVLEAVGFIVTQRQVGQSDHPLLRGLEQHGNVVGSNVNAVETSCLEARKRG